MATLINPQQAEFSKRITRINNPHNVSWYDPNTDMQIPKQFSKGKGIRKASMLGNLGYPISIVLAVMLGCMTVVLSRYVRFHLLGYDDTSAGVSGDMMMAIDAGVGIGVSFFLRQLFKLQSKTHATGQTLGMVAMILLMHNLVWIAPDQFAMIFSQEWVDMTKSYTQPRTLLFRGVTMTF